ncbi:MAG TPA: hypothetical protein VG167_16895 [Verrucomicrobiae bacterium]|nr:hypothetical protein [Verrucomicrobiae bacterium]
MDQNFEKTAEQAAAFQKMWSETASKIVQAAFTFSPNSAPPDILRQIRSGIFAALGQSWEEFMRSPQFIESMKQWMDSAITFRKLTNDFLAKARSDLQAPSRQDIDTLMLTIRHMEKRVLDRLDDLAVEVRELSSKANRNGGTRTAGRTRAGNRPTRPTATKTQRL